MARDFYQVLSLPRDATPKDVKSRFRALAREHHPDRFSGAEKARAEVAFQEITEAFNVLMDPQRRRQHDQELDKPVNRGQDKQQLVRLYLNRGIRAYKAENWIEAADSFRRATEADSQSAQAWHHLALTCVQQERWLPQAREAIERALELDAEKPSYLKLAGKVFADSGMTARAKEYYNQVLKQGPDAGARRALEALTGTPEKSAEAKRESGLFKKLF
ncbi:MAG: DnaJ domain-containing protein [Acidobacteriota bacterium]